MALNHNDATAHALWGDAYDAIPKSVFAAIAWHLANLASGCCDEPGMAEKRFLEEWDALLSHGLSAPSKKLRASMSTPIAEVA
jgi:hypothetical protein